MKKVTFAWVAAAFLGASAGVGAQTLTFSTSVSSNAIPAEPANPSAVPILTRNPAPNLGGFINENVAYNGFFFNFVNTPGSPDAWVWMTEPAAPNPGFQSYGYAYNSGVAGNGYLLHGCSFGGCGSGVELTNTITSATPFRLESLKVSRFANGGFGPDPLTMTLSGGSGPNRVVDLVALTPGALDFVPMTAVNPWAGEFFTTIQFAGFKGYFGLDDINYSLTPIPEPGTYALMLMGLGAVGLVVRRRKQA